MIKFTYVLFHLRISLRGVVIAFPEEIFKVAGPTFLIRPPKSISVIQATWLELELLLRHKPTVS